MILFLLLVYLFVPVCIFLVSPINQYNYTVRVDKNGSDQPHCLLGNGSCHTLEYVLHALSSANFAGMNFSIVLSYSQQIDQLYYIIFHNISMELKGVGMPVLSISNKFSLDFINFHFFSANGLTVQKLESIHLKNGQSVKFSNCSFEFISFLRFNHVHDLKFSYCAFKSGLSNISHTYFGLYVVNNTKFDGCTFQSLTAIHYLITCIKEISELHIINCSYERIVGGILSVSTNINKRPAKIVIENTSISNTVNNKNDNFLIRFAWDPFFEGMTANVNISITSSNFIDNVLSTVYNSFKSSIISISCLSGSIQDACYIPIHLSVMNVTFRNNLGTGLFLNQLPRYGNKILDSVFFFNNTGLYGAGITIQSSNVELQNVSFIKNTALYGGSIFIPSQQCSYFGRNNHTDIHFSENKGLANI